MSNAADGGKENDEGPELVSEFPLPPKYFVLYKDDVENGPTPPPPLSPTYYSFGTPYSTKDCVPDLLPDSSRKLYKTSNQVDFKVELKRLNYSLLASFIQLIEVLIRSPDHYNDKLGDIELLFLNMHNLINSYRPHQARETLIEYLKCQVIARKEATEEIRKYIEEAKSAISAAHSCLEDENEDDTDILPPKVNENESLSGKKHLLDLEKEDDTLLTYHSFLNKIVKITE